VGGGGGSNGVPSHTPRHFIDIGLHNCSSLPLLEIPSISPVPIDKEYLIAKFGFSVFFLFKKLFLFQLVLQSSLVLYSDDSWHICVLQLVALCRMEYPLLLNKIVAHKTFLLPDLPELRPNSWM
jgi:hypothetical protein